MYFEIRSVVEAGRARIGLPASQRFRSSASSLGRAVAILGGFLQAFQADCLEVAIDLGVDRARALRLLIDHLPQCLRVIEVAHGTAVAP